MMISVAVLAAVTLAPAGPASAAVPGLERVLSPESVNNSTSPKTAVATCPAGKRVIGTGARISGGQGQVAIDDLTPNANLTAVRVTGYEDDDGFSGNWTVLAIAICANPLPGLERVANAEGPNPDNAKSVDAQCPGTKRVIGSGAEITGGLGQVNIEFLFPQFTPRLSSGRAFEDQDGASGNWTFTVYSICADSSLPGQRLQAESTGFDSLSPKGITAGCPAQRVVSPGFAIVQGNGQVAIQEIIPNSTLTTHRVAAAEDQDGLSGVWDLRSFPTCADQ